MSKYYDKDVVDILQLEPEVLRVEFQVDNPYTYVDIYLPDIEDILKANGYIKEDSKWV